MSPQLPTKFAPDGYGVAAAVSSPVSTINRGDSTGSYVSQRGPEQYQGYEDPFTNVVRRPSDMLRTLADYTSRGPLELHGDEEGEYWEDEDEEDESRFVNFSLLSHIAVQLRDKVPRGTHVKGSIPYPRAFTGKDIVVIVDPFCFSSCVKIPFYAVDDSIVNPTRTCPQPRDLHQRQTCRTSSRPQPAKPAILL